MDTILHIGTDAGVITLRSRDRRNWDVGERNLKRWETSELVVSAEAANKVFAATRGDGVWVSDDFGKTWSKPSRGKRGPGKVRSITIDPHDSRRLYAGCEPADIFMSEDEGKNWVRFDSLWDIPSIATMPYPVPSVEPHVRDVAVDPADADILYASLQLGYIAKSQDRGRTWRLLDNNLDCDVHTINIDPGDPRRLIVATGGHDARLGRAPGRALYRTDDAGASWMPTGTDFTHEYSVPLVRDPHDPKRIYSALARDPQGRWKRRDSGAESIIIRTDDGGENWHRIGREIDGRQFPEAIAVDPVNRGHVYAACRNGDLFASEDAGDTWRAVGVDWKINDLTSVVVTHAD
jgi:photosystem II stability/assembly factor-like uncharacterized protein